MDRYERTFKIVSTAGLASVFYFRGARLTTAVLLGHSLNFVLNSNVIAALKTLDVSFYNDRSEFDSYAYRILDDFAEYEWVNDVYVAGSVNRDEWSPGSDLDVIIVRKPGFWNGIRGVFRALVTRFLATFNLFPLDIYIFDRESLEKREINEKLVPYNPTR
ncbi:nucleotidyltransferase domain-containing protein [Halalkalicoccus salilacus]|uniref:nucleotidyltransferase domain-containing protein n=1 Tax=Halalkalicoccus salilacus TaxID=3117459 RepID=UPI00300EF4CE